VLLMTPNNFYNIWILVQAFHGKLGNAHLFLLFGMARITIAVL
jgi:hypothetical protein